MTSWKTTTLGVCAIVSAVISIITDIVNGKAVDLPTTIAAIMSGIGLVAAKDHNVTGGTKDTGTTPPP